MPRPILNARLHLLALLLIWAAWMATTGMVMRRLNADPEQAVPGWSFGVAAEGYTQLLAALAWAFVTARLPELARQGRVWPVRVVGMSGLLGVLALLLGRGGWVGEPADNGLMFARAALGLVGLFLVILAPAGPVMPARFFLVGRHANDAIARRSLVATAGQAMLVMLAVRLAVISAVPFMNVASAYVIGIAMTLWQRYPQRAIAFIPIGWTLSAIALLAAWLLPSAEWPVLMLAASLGLGHNAPRNDLLANVPDSQRAAGLMVVFAALVFGLVAGALPLLALAPAGRPVWFAVAALLAALAVYGYLRELVEQIVEPILAISYRIRGYGPGLKVLPTRGPILIYANHCAWLDPLWVAKLVPLRLKPMMTSKFYDKPLISWLMRHVFHTIRVPEVAFRREAPEIQEAIAALDRGENVLIFPEGWLKRKEEQSIRRFGQGIYQILREKPGTPVVACWIEGGWGSYMSYKNGPPTVNKKPDFLRLIRIGIAEPEVLSLDLLHDGRATRRHLMLACLHARTYLGLPELPPPPFALSDENEETS